MKEVIDAKLCYGCGACAKLCPVGCISMERDEKGFLYPVIDQERCIDCGTCRKNCIAGQYGKDGQKANAPAVCIGVHKDEKIWMNSASGGAFSAIVKALEQENFAVFGAGWDSENRVAHSYADNEEKTQAFRKSKYVQSYMGDSYQTAEAFLKEGKRVVFSGTPCQIAGLYAALGRDYPNLYTIDLICTGVVSPLLYEKFLSFLEKKYKSGVVKVDMRYKVKNKEGWNIGDTQVTFGDGRRIRNRDSRLYRQLYGQKTAYRESCYNCQFANSDRIGDITIGDWWGSLDRLPEVKEHKGISLILFNSEKGKELMEAVRQNMYMEKIDLDAALADNPTLSHATVRSRRCDELWRDFAGMKDAAFLKKHARPPLKIYIPWVISRIIPASFRRKIRKLVGR